MMPHRTQILTLKSLIRREDLETKLYDTCEPTFTLRHGESLTDKFSQKNHLLSMLVFLVSAVCLSICLSDLSDDLSVCLFVKVFLANRLRKCNLFCIICAKKVEISSIKPSLCDKQDCKIRYEGLGIGYARPRIL
jgi:hypothetical protein